MPDIFKALATIMAWIMWICAIISGFSTFAMGILSGELYGGGATMIYPAMFAVSGFLALGAVVIMLLRKKME
jgi:hypothetical protein